MAAWYEGYDARRARRSAVPGGRRRVPPGNEPQDRAWLATAGGRPAYIVASAAVRQGPDRAVATARAWFGALGVGATVEELRLRGRRDATDPATVERAAAAGAFYLVGGDPGLVVRILTGTPAWKAIVRAWREGGALAGSSAGAMALGEWTLLRGGHPGDAERRPSPALGVVPRLIVLPHFEQFGEGWIPSARATRPDADAVLLGIDTRTAAAWIDGAWRVMGAGAVTFIGDRELRRHEAGQAIEDLPPPSLAD